MPDLIRTTAYNLRPYSSELCLQEHLETSTFNFKSKLFAMYVKEMKEKLPHNKTPWRYELFKENGDRIYYNSKLKLFEHFIPCDKLRHFCELPINSEIPIAESTPKKAAEKFQKDVSCLFGPGEFPHMSFHVIELPDAPYCFYTIHR